MTERLTDSPEPYCAGPALKPTPTQLVRLEREACAIRADIDRQERRLRLVRARELAAVLTLTLDQIGATPGIDV